ncbi:GNAT family N-acetyltransferase [Pseudoflavitalea sp. X16]|uniref:GNAT family N-acetyltransferase n=1 Tax=Paraflavitalea devenefica TaxID=2716334 RepID=UPI001422AB89|nr:GNAT family N-acetyltransferase [Paraflavitalea devenefica]NII29058.1 GNAT family N-acetyltransferase [Paraflavitalea devenefica]
MIIKPADQDAEFYQIHQLNYKTFVEEIPQHKHNEEKILVDKFHFKNKYIIALKDQQLIGMVCYNQLRPFSLDEKIPDLDRFLPACTNLAEIRLLAVAPAARKITVTYRLLQYLCTELIRNNIDAAVISGTTRQIRLYASMGFTPFGPLVGHQGALYQPMSITLNKLRNDFRTH